MLGWLMLGAALTIDIWEDDKKKMRNWSEQKLHAYAGVKSHPKALKCYAYELAKKKKFERLK